MPKKLRLDQVLVNRGFFPSREQARRAVMAGEVKIGTRLGLKPAQLIDSHEEITVKAAKRFVGRGALKLEGALDHFQIGMEGKTALDIGASTGGFTD